MYKLFVVLAASTLIATGCASVPKSDSGREALKADAKQALDEMVAKSPNLTSIMKDSVGYVVFPDVARGGFVVGGGGGEGVLFENGRAVGFAELSQASVGAQVGGQRYAELIVLRDRDALQRMKDGKFDFGGQVSAVAIRAGASAEAQFRDGVAVFVHPKGGAMLDVSLAGQRVKVVM